MFEVLLFLFFALFVLAFISGFIMMLGSIYTLFLVITGLRKKNEHE